MKPSAADRARARWFRPVPRPQPAIPTWGMTPDVWLLVHVPVVMMLMGCR